MCDKHIIKKAQKSRKEFFGFRYLSPPPRQTPVLLQMRRSVLCYVFLSSQLLFLETATLLFALLLHRPIYLSISVRMCNFHLNLLHPCHPNVRCDVFVVEGFDAGKTKASSLTSTREEKRSTHPHWRVSPVELQLQIEFNLIFGRYKSDSQSGQRYQTVVLAQWINTQTGYEQCQEYYSIAKMKVQ